ncbi:MAG TPA: hypothetical protein VJ793_26535 [Anaerolineae bacterium]|nr:hypothetical protein [Anaerolineae bacterium]
MMVEAITGIAAGTLIAAALAGIRRVRNWSKVGRIAAIVSLLAGLLAALRPVWQPAAGALPAATYAALFIAAGGLILAIVEIAPPWMLLASSSLLIHATLAPGEAAAPISIAALAIIVASVETLPGLDAAARSWRASVDGTRIVLWLGISIALAASAAASLLERGAWLGSAPRDAWLMAAWITSSGSLLVEHSRWRAALMFAAALCVGLGALSL